MKNLTIIIFALFFGNAFAQEKVIERITEKGKNSIEIFCKNNSNFTQEVTLTLKKIKGVSGYKKPIKKQIAPKEKLLFINLSFKGKYSYSTSISHKKVITKKEKEEERERKKEIEKERERKREIEKEKEKQELEKKKKKLLLKDFSDINKGIVVFEKTGCGRCRLATSYLLKNNVEFKILNITDDVKSKELVWKLLRDSGHEGRYTTPVILVDGQLSHSHKDLKKFLQELKNK